MVDPVEGWPRTWESARGVQSDMEGSIMARQGGARSREQEEWIADVRKHPVLTQGGGRPTTQSPARIRPDRKAGTEHGSNDYQSLGAAW